MNIEGVFRVLEDLVAQGLVVSYAVGGAVAATYFLEPFATQDVAVFVRLPAESERTLLDPTPVFAFLTRSGYELEGDYVMIEGWPVQFLAPPGALGEEALERAHTVDAGETAVRILSAEYLAAIALATGRAKDRARLLMFLESPGFDRAAYEEIVERHGLDAAWAKFVRDFDL